MGVSDGCKGRRRGQRTVKWSGKNEFWSGKSQGISFQTKSGYPAVGYQDIHKSMDEFEFLSYPITDYGVS